MKRALTGSLHRLPAASPVMVLAAMFVGPAAASDVHTERMVFENLGCGQDRMQVFVRALAVTQNMGYETRNVDGEEGTFEGRLKQSGRRLRIDVEVTCSGRERIGKDAFDAFFGPPRVEVEARFEARRGGRAAARADGERFRVELGDLMEASVPPASCLGLTISGVGDLSAETRRRLGADSGVVVNDVVDGGPGAAAGLRPWDVMLGVDGIETPNVGSLRRVLHRKGPGDTVSLLVSRGGETVRAAVVLGRREDDGSCLTPGAGAATHPAAPKPEPPQEDTLSLVDVVIKPQPVPPGGAFDVVLTIEFASVAAADASVGVGLNVEIIRDGRTLFTSSPETVECRSGAVTTAIKHLRAGTRPGAYDVRVSVEAGLQRDTRTVLLEIR